MPRGQVAHLKDKQFKPQWNSLPTATIRVPVLIGGQARVIAQWADRQDDPVVAMQRLLDWIKLQK